MWMIAAMAAYQLKGIPKPLWSRVRARAAVEGHTVRFVLLKFLHNYASVKPRGTFLDEGELIDAAQEGTTRGRK